MSSGCTARHVDSKSKSVWARPRRGRPPTVFRPANRRCRRCARWARRWRECGPRTAPRRSRPWCRRCRTGTSVARRAACCTPKTKWRRRVGRRPRAGRTRSDWPSSAKPCRPAERPKPAKPAATWRTCAAYSRHVNVWVPPGVRSATASGSIAAVRWNASHMVAGRSVVVISVLLRLLTSDASPTSHR